jgi:hypothetical protein
VPVARPADDKLLHDDDLSVIGSWSEASRGCVPPSSGRVRSARMYRRARSLAISRRSLMETSSGRPMNTRSNAARWLRQRSIHLPYVGCGGKVSGCSAKICWRRGCATAPRPPRYVVALPGSIAGLLRPQPAAGGSPGAQNALWNARSYSIRELAAALLPRTPGMGKITAEERLVHRRRFERHHQRRRDRAARSSRDGSDFEGLRLHRERRAGVRGDAAAG